MRYHILKERLRKHLSWEKQLQRMINVLDSDSDYEKELTQLLEAAANHNSTQSGWMARSRTLGSTTSNSHKPEFGYMDPNPPRIDDATFLTELSVLQDERPAYADIARKIFQEATECLGAKLRKVSKDIARHAEIEGNRHLQEISSSFRKRRRKAEERSKLRLMDLIRRALDEEPGHPTNLYVYDFSHRPTSP